MVGRSLFFLRIARVAIEVVFVTDDGRDLFSDVRVTSQVSKLEDLDMNAAAR